MKVCNKLFCILFLVYGINIFPQIPNAGFESWTDPFSPEGWTSNNAAPSHTPVTRTTIAYNGSFAASLQIVFSSNGPIPPQMQSSPFPVTQAFGSIMGQYQFYKNASTEILYVVAWFLQDGKTVGEGRIDIGSAATSYTTFSFGIKYINDEVVPDSAYIWIGITDASGNPPLGGGYGYVDELSFVTP